MTDPVNLAHIQLDNDRKTFRPGERIRGFAAWRIDRPLREASVRLFWYTKGKGTRDLEVVDAVEFEHPQPTEKRDFEFVAPASPYSFSGKLVSIVWGVELILKPAKETAKVDLVISPTGEEVVFSEQ